MSEHILEVTPNNFEEILASDKPVLADFHAVWCGPCKMIAPFLDEIAEEMKNEAIIAKIDIDKCPDIAARFDVMSVPTLMVFKDGIAVKKETGARPKSVIKAMLEE